MIRTTLAEAKEAGHRHGGTVSVRGGGMVPSRHRTYGSHPFSMFAHANEGIVTSVVP